MDEFALDRTGLDGFLISMEFGPGGRISQLWASDPASPDPGEQFQFCAANLPMGEESASDYLPGTLLIGARTHPEEPFVLVRNNGASDPDGDAEDEDGEGAFFEYDLGFLEELSATGRFYEMDDSPTVAWDIVLTNKSRRSVEIGELAFPFAFNTPLVAGGRTDTALRELAKERVALHKFLGGEASYLLATRLGGAGGGLLVTPAPGTSWEFATHVPSSLTTDWDWEGVPVVYVHSRAAAEREDWGEWTGEHTATVLEPGETRTYGIRFTAIPSGIEPPVVPGHPTFRPFPGAVAPADVGIGIEVTGVTPARFTSTDPGELETDADENGGFLFVRPVEPGPVRIGMVDTEDGESELHLLFTPPIRDLVEARAAFVTERQLVRSGPLEGAFAPFDLVDERPLTDPGAFESPFGIEAGLSEAIFLAEKNRVMPVAEEREALLRFLDGWIPRKVQNPGDGTVASRLPDFDGVAFDTSRPDTYALLAYLQLLMDRPEAAARTLAAMGERASLEAGRPIPFLGVATALHPDPPEAALARRRRIASRRYPFAGAGAWTLRGWDEVIEAAESEGREDLLVRAVRALSASRSVAPSWWRYGSDKEASDPSDLGPYLADRGERCLTPTSAINSAALLEVFFRRPRPMPEALIRASFGGLLSPWALVRSDGAAGDGFGPDPGSKNFGIGASSGRIGLALAAYLRVASATVATAPGGPQPFLCHLDAEERNGRERITIAPWDGLGREVRARAFGLRVVARGARIVSIAFPPDKSTLDVTLADPFGEDRTLVVEGLWGVRARISDAGSGESRIIEADRGVFSVAVPSSPTTLTLSIV